MNLTEGALSPALQWALHIAYAAVLFIALRRAPWPRLRDATALHVWLGAGVTALALWQIKAGIKPGLDLHLLGASALSLISGPALAIVALSVVLLANILLGEASIASLAFNGLLLIALPIGVTRLVFDLSARYLPRHLFVYLFITVFFGTALAMAAAALAVNTVLALSGVYPAGYLASDYLPYFLLLAWPEALLTGMALTLMVVFRPGWVASFDENLYLGAPRR